jgi:hypothetical protein
MKDIYFHGIWRMDWGLGNPNKTATLIAMLMVSVWAFAYVRKWGFWIALIAFIGFGICLVHTLSRGGLVALSAGVMVLLWTAPRPWPKMRIAASLVVFWIFVLTAVYLRAHERFAQGIGGEDRSITNRLKIWSQVPKMMNDAPSGWGRNNAQMAYMQWYQSVDASESYLNLVSSHFTWMVEMGWWGRFAYVTSWSLAILLCWPTPAAPWRAIASGIWISFAVGAVFTHVADSWWLWVLPVLALAFVLGARLSNKEWSRLPVCAAVATAACLILSTFCVAGATRSALPLRGSEKVVVIGSGNPRIWVVRNSKVMGNNYGKTLRRYLLGNGGRPFPAVAFVSSLSEIQMAQQDTIVVAGAISQGEVNALATAAPRAARLLFLNPGFYPQELGIVGMEQKQTTQAFFGEFSQSPTVSAWAGFATVRQIEAVGDYLPQWPELIFGSHS